MLCHPHIVVASHHRRIAEEEEGTRHKGGIEDVHTRTAKDFLGKDDAECHSQSQHPQRSVYRNNHGNDDTAHQEALLDFLTLPLGHHKLYAQTHDVADNNLGQYGQQAETEDVAETGIAEGAGSQVVLVTHIVHAKQQSGQERNHHKTHDALAVDSIVDVHAACTAGLVGHERKGLESVHQAPEGMELSTLLNHRLYVIEKFS